MLFGKQLFCLGETCHFRHFRRFPGSEEQSPLFFVGTICYQNSRRFRQGTKTPFSKTTVLTSPRPPKHDFARSRHLSANFPLVSANFRRVIQRRFPFNTTAQRAQNNIAPPPCCDSKRETSYETNSNSGPDSSSQNHRATRVWTANRFISLTRAHDRLSTLPPKQTNEVGLGDPFLRAPLSQNQVGIKRWP